MEAAGEMGYPVVLKQIQPFILHKTEMGAVRLGIRDDEKLEQAFGKMGEDLYLLQKMLPDGVDTIIGGKRDGQFGAVVMFGLGGIFVEVLKDVTVMVAPIGESRCLGNDRRDQRSASSQGSAGGCNVRCREHRQAHRKRFSDDGGASRYPES